MFFFFFSSRRRHTRLQGDWSSDVCSSDLSRPSTNCRPRKRSRKPCAARCAKPPPPPGAAPSPAASAKASWPTPCARRAPPSRGAAACSKSGAAAWPRCWTPSWTCSACCWTRPTPSTTSASTNCAWHAPPAASCPRTDRKSTRLNSSHLVISYAVFCLNDNVLHLLGLALPLFFQVVVDKVLVYEAVSTLQVLTIGVAVRPTFGDVLKDLLCCLATVARA